LKNSFRLLPSTWKPSLPVPVASALRASSSILPLTLRQISAVKRPFFSTTAPQ
jgi:hypothetical protein